MTTSLARANMFGGATIMMKTRIRSMWWKSLLSVTAILAMASCMALAPRTADAAEGDLTTGTRIAAGDIFASGSGTEADPYVIETAEQLASAGIIGGSENAGMGSIIYYATDALVKIKSENADTVAFGYINPNIYRDFKERYPDGYPVGAIGKTTADMRSEAFATALNGNLKAVKDKTGIVPDKWVFDGNRVVLSTE